MWRYLNSAYQKSHSTETAILKVQSDISSALDRRTVVVMVKLDMSAAFDTVNHNILLERMKSEFGLSEKVISWFASYLNNRIQHVVVYGARSVSVGLNHGVPQDSVLGPRLFSMYPYPLGSITSRHGLKCHIYADDTQIYFAIGLKFILMLWSRFVDWIKELKQCINMLQLNTPKRMTDLSNDITLHLDDIVISPKGQVRSLGIHLDRSLKMDHHINFLCKVCIFQLRNICRIRKYLTTYATKTIVHSLVITRLDYGS